MRNDSHRCVVTGPDAHGSMYIYIRQRLVGGKRVRSIKHPGTVVLDYDAKGRLFGIEILSVMPAVKFSRNRREK